MIYENMLSAVFLDRPNRFIANILIDGEMAVCHVKNTGRCRELLVPGADIIVQRSDNPNRRTKYDLISVYKGTRLINMDSAAPNAVFGEWLKAGGAGEIPTLIKPECTHGDSRFDFYFEIGDRRIFAEVKGVTLEENGIVRFPDAPTERGAKHLRGLSNCTDEGYESWAVFVIQMDDVKYFEPNTARDPVFSAELRRAAEAGVRLMALDCKVGKDSLSIAKPVEIRL